MPRALVSTGFTAGIGEFALPLTKSEFVTLLAAGTPVEIGRKFIFKWWQHLEEVCLPAEVNVAMDQRTAQVRPVKVVIRKGVAI